VQRKIVRWFGWKRIYEVWSLLKVSACPLNQGRNEVSWRPGQEASLVPPYSNLRSFRSKCTVLKKVIVILLGLFGVPSNHSSPPAVIWRPGNCSPLAPLVTPLLVNHEIPYDTAMKSYLRPRCLPFERTGEEIFPALRASLTATEK